MRIIKEEAPLGATISEIDLLKQQLYGCWTVPTGIDHDLLRKIVVPVKIKVNPNRTVSNARIIDTNEMQGTVVFGVLLKVH